MAVVGLMTVQGNRESSRDLSRSVRYGRFNRKSPFTFYPSLVTLPMTPEHAAPAS
jgi:hypothetical protein